MGGQATNICKCFQYCKYLIKCEVPSDTLTSSFTHEKQEGAVTCFNIMQERGNLHQAHENTPQIAAGICIEFHNLKLSRPNETKHHPIVPGGKQLLRSSDKPVQSCSSPKKNAILSASSGFRFCLPLFLL